MPSTLPHRKKRVLVLCKQCKVILTKRTGSLFCSRMCSGLGRRKRIKVGCQFCLKEFETWTCRIEDGQGKFCSKTCSNRAHAHEGEAAHNWKGDAVGYGGIHYWIKKMLGKAIRCEGENCSGVSRKYEWANISRKYKRELNDWKQLCKSCHVNFDMTDEWRKNTSKGLLGNIPWNKGLKGVCKPNSGSFKKLQTSK